MNHGLLGARPHLLGHLDRRVGAVNFIVTTFKMRAPGMTMNRMPVLAWSTLGMGLLVIFAVPSISLAAAPAGGRPPLGTSFFVPAGGGDPLLWQHLFWFFGHPEVYILLLPAMGMVSRSSPSLSAQAAVRLHSWWSPWSPSPSSASACGCTTCSPRGWGRWPRSFFSARRRIIAIPTGVKFFNWIGDHVAGRFRWTTPMLFCARLLRDLPHRRAVRRHARRHALRLSAARHLLRGRPLPLRAVRRLLFPYLRRHLLLVPEDDGPAADERLGKCTSG